MVHARKRVDSDDRYQQEGEKMTYIIPPGTAEAYQKCIDTGAENARGNFARRRWTD